MIARHQRNSSGFLLRGRGGLHIESRCTTEAEFPGALLEEDTWR